MHNHRHALKLESHEYHILQDKIHGHATKKSKLNYPFVFQLVKKSFKLVKL